MRMQNIEVERYDEGVHGWLGNIQPEDRSWIIFVNDEGRPVFYPHRDEDGGVVGPPIYEY
jgi:hypothetical protein